jgi:hypothetical protein
LLVGALCVVLLSGCDFGSPWGSSSTGANYGNVTTPGSTGGTGGTGTGGGTSPPGGVGGEGGVSGTDNSVVATVSVGGTVTVATGASEIVSITFTSSDGLPITGFGISGAALGALPAGWSGPSSFSCARVQAGSNCVLNLTYAPAAVDSGTLMLNYVFIDNANEARTPSGAVSIPYAATAANNVLALASPSGQVNARVGGGAQTVSVNFTTDNGYAATNLSLGTALANLPAGWSSKAASFSCAIVSTGSSCQLPLSYDPVAAGGGTLALNFSFTDDTGATHNGIINIPYATSGASEVVASAAPSGQVEAVEKTGGTPVTVTFTTDDGGTATGLSVSGLAKLPAGWSAAPSTLSCGSVSTGNGCQLHLTYAPTALASGVLSLGYQYSNQSGAQSGVVNLAYTATTNDNVVATPMPSGQINAVVGGGSQTVLVTFATDDGEPATALDVTNLTALPAGWSTPSPTFACAGLSSGSACQLSLTYNPAAAASGTLTLDFTYVNNAGVSKNATLNIPYRATTNDNVVGAPSSANLAVAVGSNNPVSVTFTTDDANPATMLNITSGLATLPAGWSGPATFSCAALSTGNGCQLALMYTPQTPTPPGGQTLTLTFSYLNDAGIAKTGSVTIQYSAS